MSLGLGHHNRMVLRLTLAFRPMVSPSQQRGSRFNENMARDVPSG